MSFTVHGIVPPSCCMYFLGLRPWKYIQPLHGRYPIHHETTITCTCLHTCTRKPTHAHLHTHTHTHTHTHACTHTHAHTHMHTCKNVIKHTCAIHRKDKGTYMGLSYTKAIYGTKNTTTYKGAVNNNRHIRMWLRCQIWKRIIIH